MFIENYNDMERLAKKHYLLYQMVSYPEYFNADEEVICLVGTDEFVDEIGREMYMELKDRFATAEDPQRVPIYLLVGYRGDVVRMGFLLHKSAVSNDHYIHDFCKIS